MVKLSVEEIKAIIRPCGLSPAKSKLFGICPILIENTNGEVPDNFNDLEDLPGVGHKTASVVMSQAFGFPAFPVDTHIHRLMYRWGLQREKRVNRTEIDAKNSSQRQMEQAPFADYFLRREYQSGSRIQTRE